MFRDEMMSAGRQGLQGFGVAVSFPFCLLVLAGLLLQSAPAPAADFSVGDGGSLRINDGARSFQLGGRVRLNTVFYDQDVAHLPTGYEMDQALLNMRADMGDGWSMNVGYEFVDRTLFDTSLTKSGLPIGDLTIGQFRPQVGLFDGGAWIIFNQRSMVEAALTIPRTLGLGLEGSAGRISYGLAINSDPIDRRTPGDPLRYSGRLVVRPAPASWGVFHVGLNAIHQEMGDSQVSRIGVDPVAALADTPRLLEAVQNYAKSRDVLGAEALWKSGPLTLQSEYMRARIDSPGFPELDGYYVQGTYLIGAERRYADRGATVGRPFLFHPPAGAWEFGLRYDTLDLTNAGGGAAENVGLAIVRYFNNPLRLGTTVTHSKIEKGLNGDESIVSVQIRMQWFL